jgi:hypothetical protein
MTNTTVQSEESVKKKREAAKEERAGMISEVMAHPAIVAHVALYERIVTVAERQAAAFEKIADALSRMVPAPGGTNEGSAQ